MMFLASKAFITAGGKAFSLVKGPPGIACIKTNVIVIINNRVIIIENNLFTINLPKSSTPLYHIFTLKLPFYILFHQSVWS